MPKFVEKKTFDIVHALEPIPPDSNKARAVDINIEIGIS
jgi:hypothetical protein